MCLVDLLTDIHKEYNGSVAYLQEKSFYMSYTYKIHFSSSVLINNRKNVLLNTMYIYIIIRLM